MLLSPAELFLAQVRQGSIPESINHITCGRPVKTEPSHEVLLFIPKTFSIKTEQRFNYTEMEYLHNFPLRPPGCLVGVPNCGGYSVLENEDSRSLASRTCACGLGSGVAHSRRETESWSTHVSTAHRSRKHKPNSPAQDWPDLEAEHQAQWRAQFNHTANFSLSHYAWILL